MRTQLAVATPTAGTPAVPVTSTRRRIDPFEIAVLTAFSAVSVWVLGLDLWQVVVHGRVWTGTDGFFVIDQLQYLAWIRDASHHVLASNLFVLRGTPADYFQPAIAISGALAALGVPAWLALLLWKPVAVAGIFFGVRAYAYRSFAGRSQRRAVLALGLFFGSFSIVYGAFGVVGDLFPGFLSWGYPFGLMALAAMLFALLAYERDRNANRIGFTAPALGVLASSLHPWQGELLILTVIGAELLRRRDLAREQRRTRGWHEPRPRGWQQRTARMREGRAVRMRDRRQWALPAATVVATAVPLAYYAILGKVDLSWGLARVASKHSFSFWSIVLALAPLALPALLGYRNPQRNFLGAVTRAWPIAALVVYALSATDLAATPLHAFEGVTIPLAVLAVDGVQRTRVLGFRRARLLGWLAIAAATIPATVYELSIARDFMAPTPGNANFITSDERAAISYLNHDRDEGGVLTRFYLGSVVPARTGRRTFVGNCLWSEPSCSPRAQVVQKLFDGSLLPPAARGFVRQTGARFVLADCQSRSNLTKTLAPLIVSVHRFGCAGVYELDAPTAPTGALAESHLHAAFRAPWRQQRRVQSGRRNPRGNRRVDARVDGAKHARA